MTRCFADSCEVGALENPDRGELVSHRAALYTDGVHEADVQLARDDRGRDEAAARHGDDAASV